MSKFYTYCYLDENNKPYYIGKGTGRRAYKVHNNDGQYSPVGTVGLGFKF